MKPVSNKRFISIEGIEGVGKTTVVKHIEAYFARHAIPYILTREPGGTPIAEEVRKVLLAQHTEDMSSDSELLLMFAGRAQNLASVIKPALTRGDWVISDRFTDASRAYQGGGRGVPMQHINELAAWVQQGLEPSHTLLLDAPVACAMSRVHSRGAKDRIESEGHDFFEKARDTYLQLAAAEPQRITVIDATQPLKQVQQQVEDLLTIWTKQTNDVT